MRGIKLLAHAVGALAITAIYARPAMAKPATAIEHVVVIFQENVSFDHYFGTYPNATNPAGEPRFVAQQGTPTVNGLTGALLSANPNKSNGANGSNAINPFRLDRSQASTCDQDHTYGDEQKAFDQGLMDLFPSSVGSGDGGACLPFYSYGKGNGIVMSYFDGNTVTALWNYAQHYALNDNFYGTTFGPSTPGALNLVAGNTYPATPSASTPKVVAVSNGHGTLVGDLDPADDECSRGPTIRMDGKNIGDLLNAHGISWGAFMGGFDLTITNANGTTKCDRSSPATPANYTDSVPPPPDKNFTADYIAHHAWFQYFGSTANPAHARPIVPPSQYGTAADTVTKHQYDIHDFFDALHEHNLPAVSFLKAPANMDGHAGYSDPILEQQFVVGTINAIQKSEFWSSTAVVITWDDSDGWYDHQMSPIINSSAVLQTGLTVTQNSHNSDQLNGSGKCGNGVPLGGIEGRCGYGPRIPILVISPFAKQNFVDHTLTDQSSILRFIEDNWGLGRIGSGSFDAISGSIENMFDFTMKVSPSRRHQTLLDPATGLTTGGDQR